MARNIKNLKQFIVRKYIMAKSAAEAIKKDKMAPVDDVWVDEKWKEENDKELIKVGFNKKS